MILYKYLSQTSNKFFSMRIWFNRVLKSFTLLAITTVPPMPSKGALLLMSCAKKFHSVMKLYTSIVYY